MKSLLFVFVIAVYLTYCAAHSFGGSSEKRHGACNSTSCLNNGTCVQSGRHSRCQCQTNYIGFSCEQFDFCSSNPCQYPQLCRNVNATYYNCSCPRGYTLNATINNCTAIDACATLVPCQNNGTCTNQPVVLYRRPDYTCNCTTGYIGYNCEFKNYCYANPTVCQNGGTCYPRGNNYKCNCTIDYGGKNCTDQRHRG